MFNVKRNKYKTFPIYRACTIGGYAIPQDFIDTWILNIFFLNLKNCSGLVSETLVFIF